MSFTGSIPEFYDRYLGPFMFDAYARDMARRLFATPAAVVLETACGTGIVTRHLREALPPDVRLVATDLNDAMIDFARGHLRGLDVHWRAADACELPFKDGTFDAVVCQFGMMFLPDKHKGFAEARRVLRPGGAFLANCWCPLSDNPVAGAVHETAGALYPDNPPRFLETPYGFGDPATLSHLAREGGFAGAEVERVELTGRAPSARDPVTGFVKGTPLSTQLAERGADPDAVIALTLERMKAPAAGPFTSPLAAVVLRAT